MTNPDVSIILTSEEQKALLTLIDIALKHPNAGGLNIAINAAVLAQKIHNAPPVQVPVIVEKESE